MPGILPLLVVAALASVAAPAAGQGQQDRPPAFLILNQERILTGSRAGQALLEEEEAAREALRAEAREIDARFEAEEQRLTELRGEMEPEEFRPLADAFDARVVEARQRQDERSNALVLEFDLRRRAFYQQVAPILVNLLSRFGAHAILDESSVLLADQSLNITDAVIAEIDAAAAEGAAPEAAPDGPAGGGPPEATDDTTDGASEGDAPPLPGE